MNTLQAASAVIETATMNPITLDRSALVIHTIYVKDIKFMSTQLRGRLAVHKVVKYTPMGVRGSITLELLRRIPTTNHGECTKSTHIAPMQLNTMVVVRVLVKPAHDATVITTTMSTLQTSTHVTMLTIPLTPSLI